MPTKWIHLYPTLRASLIEKLLETSDPDKRVHYAHLLVVVEESNHKRTPHNCNEKYRPKDGGHLEPGGAS